MKRIIEISLETAETIVVQNTRSIRRQYCPDCEKLVEMVSPDIVAAISGVSEREIFRLIERGAFHFVETQRLFICMNSVKAIKGDLRQ
jgi:hypothetical protein